MEWVRIADGNSVVQRPSKAIKGGQNPHNGLGKSEILQETPCFFGKIYATFL
jgi:hypothetical protein